MKACIYDSFKSVKDAIRNATKNRLSDWIYKFIQIRRFFDSLSSENIRNRFCSECDFLTILSSINIWCCLVIYIKIDMWHSRILGSFEVNKYQVCLFAKCDMACKKVVWQWSRNQIWSDMEVFVGFLTRTKLENLAFKNLYKSGIKQQQREIWLGYCVWESPLSSGYGIA